MPRVGGIAIALSYATAILVALLLPAPYGMHVSFSGKMPFAYLLPVAAGLIFLTGLIDDLVQLKPWQKLLGQAVAAGVAYGGGVQLHFQGMPAGLDWLSAPATIIWLVGCANAFNLIDGLDGLAAGVGLFATLTVLIAAMLSGDLELALLATPLVGALLGFLRYNFNPASVFLGDSGSLTIGFLLGCYGVLWGQKSATLLGLSAPAMAMSIPLLDACLSVVRRFLRHQPIFGADRGHIHHRLLDKGITPQAAALLMYVVCCIAATLSLLQNFLPHQYGGPILILFAAAVWIGVQNLGYVELGMARQLFLKGNFRRIIDSQTRLHHLSTAIVGAGSLEECWSVLTERYKEFGFEKVRMHANGRLFEVGNNFDESDCSIFWQLRVPLPEAQYINFWRELDGDPIKNPAVMASFVKIVQEHLSSRIILEQKKPERVQIQIQVQQKITNQKRRQPPITVSEFAVSALPLQHTGASTVAEPKLS